MVYFMEKENMKKVLTILIGMVLVFSMVCCVGAADIVIEPDANGDLTTNSVTTSVEFSVSKNYEITIPDKITIGKDTGSGYGHIAVDIGTIPLNNYVNVVIEDPAAGTGDPYYNETGHYWEMKYSDEEYIPFYVGVSGAADIQEKQHINPAVHESPLIPGEGVFSVHADVKRSVEVMIHCLIPNYQTVSVDYAGAYQGQLKFVVSITDEEKAATTGVVVGYDDKFVISKGLGWN